jgi:hypothetical protein
MKNICREKQKQKIEKTHFLGSPYLSVSSVFWVTAASLALASMTL